jgi:hypothetical protein
MAHDRNLNPLYKETKLQHREQAGVYFNAEVYPVIVLDNRAYLFRN